MNIRFENSEGRNIIRYIDIEAFDTDAEANLIDALRRSGIPIISLVAEEHGQLVGHILLSPVTLDGNKPSISIAGLGPMAVLSDWQNQGIGSRLVEEGLKQCKRSGYEAIVVLGHPDYYPRFGFSPSLDYGIESEYDVPAEVFMAKEIHAGALDGCSGTVIYTKLSGMYERITSGLDGFANTPFVMSST